LQSAPNNPPAAGGVVSFPRVPSSVTTATASSTTWRRPNIYQQIQAAGQTVVSVNVLIVQANNSNWTPALVFTKPGEKLWIDSQAIGLWNSQPGTQFFDANGDPANKALASIPTLPPSSLAGKVGTSTPFLVGDDLFNYPITTVGGLSMIMNDGANWTDNSGAQLVRVIVTQ
jgi:hypothetical protein